VWPPLLSRTSRSTHGGVALGTPGNASRYRCRTGPVVCGVGCCSAHGTEQVRLELGNTRSIVVEDRCAVGDCAVSLAKPTATGGGGTAGLTQRTGPLTSGDLTGCCRRRGRGIQGGRGRPPLKAQGGDRRGDDQEAGDPGLANLDPAGRCSCLLGVAHAAIEGSVVLPGRLRFSICPRYVPARGITGARAAR
jgi:hypothetical protein